MRRLAVLLLVAAMHVASLWSGGGEWGTAVTPRADVYWMDDGDDPSGTPVFPDVAIAGELLTSSTMAASWSLGISDILAPLAPNSASLRFKGQVTAAPGDDVVISTGWGVAWVGRVDSRSLTRDVAGDYWTTVSATDMVGVLGAAELVDEEPAGGTLIEIADALSLESGVPLSVVDAATGATGLVALGQWDWAGGSSTPFSGSVLEYLNFVAQNSNAVLALLRDGTVAAVVREAVADPTALALTGVNAPVSWTTTDSLDVTVNRWHLKSGDGTTLADTTSTSFFAAAEVAAWRVDIEAYGERAYVVDNYLALSFDQFENWWDYIGANGSQRPVLTDGQLVVSSWSQEDLITLDPLEWVNDGSTDWQVLSIKHDVAPGSDWRVTITADNLLDLL